MKWFKKDNLDINYLEINEENKDTSIDYIEYGVNLLFAERGLRGPYTTNLINPNEPSEYNGLGFAKQYIMRHGEYLTDAETVIELNKKKYSFKGLMRLAFENEIINLTDERTKELNLNIILTPNSIKINGLSNAKKKCPMAFVSGNSIWILWDLRKKTETNKAILAYIIEKAVTLINEKEFPKKCPENWPEIKLNKVITSYYKTREAKIGEEILRYEQNIKDSFKDYSRATDNLELSVAEKKTIKELKTDKTNKAKKTIEYFSKCKNVKSWTINSENLLTFILTDLKMNFMKDIVPLPDLEIEVSLDSATVKLFAHDKKFEDFEPLHPHVHAHQQGNMCMGNYSKIFPKLVAKGQFHLMLDLIIQFLENYNEQSPLCQWPDFRYAIKNNISPDQMDEKQRKQAMEEWTKYRTKYEQERKKK